ncbi:MAG TPA: Hsp20/alpha crystallin family protein [Candidatus Methylacidiphilales bacterium]|nr:Hsp20/alpha crystallin family protein [Candidatus Methylacidiphilales bacterium]
MNLLSKKEPQTLAQTAPHRTITPRYGVSETADAFTITAWLPGVERASVETIVDGENLAIFGRRAWVAPEQWTPVYREIPQADYRLVLGLDHRVDREAIRAEYSQGVLTLTVPKAEAVKPRRIEIKG